MSIKTEIGDGRGNSYRAQVTSRGELVVGKIDYSTAYAVTASVINTAYNFIGPETGKRFVITDIDLYADKNVGVNDASVQVYESSSATSTVVDRNILNFEMPKLTSRTLTGLNLIVGVGEWVNIKTDDDVIFATLMGYYIDA